MSTQLKDIPRTQVPERFRETIFEQKSSLRRGLQIRKRKRIPKAKEIGSPTSQEWFNIENVICVFADMKGSTQISINKQKSSVAKAYILFTETAVKLFDQFKASYIDVKGDGVFALFNCDQVHRALASAIVFKTFAYDVFTPYVRNKHDFESGCHIGIDQHHVLVKAIGLEPSTKRADKYNEVWAGQPINVASKLCSIAENDELIVSQRYFRNLIFGNHLCRCFYSTPHKIYDNVFGSDKDIWKVDNSPDGYGFRFAYIYKFLMDGGLCKVHGSEQIEYLLELDKK